MLPPKRFTMNRCRLLIDVGKCLPQQAETELESSKSNSDKPIFSGAPHFEAVDCVGGINAHHEQNNLALCPNHAAMNKYGGLTPDGVRHAILICEGQKIPLNLAGNEIELYFTQQHLGDLRAVLNALYPDEI